MNTRTAASRAGLLAGQQRLNRFPQLVTHFHTESDTPTPDRSYVNTTRIRRPAL